MEPFVLILGWWCQSFLCEKEHVDPLVGGNDPIC